MLLVVHDEENALKRSRKDEIDVGRFAVRRPFLYWLRKKETRRWVSIYRWRQKRKGEETRRKKDPRGLLLHYALIRTSVLWLRQSSKVEGRFLSAVLFSILDRAVLRHSHVSIGGTVDASMWSLDVFNWSNENVNRSFSFHGMLNVRTIFPITTPIISPCCFVLSAFLTLLECS